LELSAQNLPPLRLHAARSHASPGDASGSAIQDGVLWRRAAAYLADVVILLFLDLLIHALLIIGGLFTFGLLWPLTSVVAFLPLAVLYGTLFIGGGEAATPGMRLFDVEVRAWRGYGYRPEHWQAFLMTVLFYATALPTSFLILAVALFTPENRAIHDALSGVVVTRRGH